MSDKIKHLQVIQGIIARMGQNSFQLRGWTITLTSAILALTISSELDSRLVIVGFFPLLSFWALDGYFLWQERMLRSKYDSVRMKRQEEIDFSINHFEFNGGRNSWIRSMLSKTLVLFYLMQIFLLFIFWVSIQLQVLS